MTARMIAPLPAQPGRRDDTLAAPHLRVVTKPELTPAAAQRRARLIAATAVVLAGLALFGVVAAHVGITQRQFRLEQLEREGNELQADYDRLRLQVAELESPARVIAAAQVLGLEQPDEVTYLTPDAGSAVAASRVATAGGQTTTSWQAVKPHLADR